MFHNFTENVTESVSFNYKHAKTLQMMYKRLGMEHKVHDSFSSICGWIENSS